MRRLIVSALYRVSIIHPRFFLRKIVFLCFVLMELAWYLLNKIESFTGLHYRTESVDFVLDNIASGERVLEVGPAEGYLSGRIVGKAGYLFGVEIDKGYFKKLELIKDRRMRFINEDIEDYEIKERFDSAVLIHTLEHIKDPGRLLERLSSCAKKLIIESPCETDWWMEKLKKDLRVASWGDARHTFTFDYTKLKRLLEECGWEITFVQQPVMLLRVVARSTKLK
ncbi:class I SAM-dependent methyltransferase [Candidatus Omnitrophota bacterium]